MNEITVIIYRFWYVHKQNALYIGVVYNISIHI